MSIVSVLTAGKVARNSCIGGSAGKQPAIPTAYNFGRQRELQRDDSHLLI